MTPLVIDHTGCPIYNYQTAGASGVLRLRKIGPTKYFIFDIAVASLPPEFTMGGMFLSPVIGGKQFVYLVWEAFGTGKNFEVFITKYDTNGQPAWQSPISFPAANGSEFFVNGGTDANDNCFLALSDANGTTTRLRLLKLGSDGSLLSDATNDEIEPTIGWGNLNVPSMPWQWNPLHPFVQRYEGFYDSYSNTWFMAGRDNLAAGNARWGAYDAVTAVRKFGGVMTPTDSDSPEAHVFPLPNLRFALVENRVHDNALFTSVLNQFNLTEYYFTGLKLWRYPVSGNDTYNVHQVVCRGKDEPIYIAGSSTDGGYYGVDPLENLLVVLDWSGSLINRNIAGHAFDIIPTADGFFSFDGNKYPVFFHQNWMGTDQDAATNMDQAQYDNADTFETSTYMLQHIGSPMSSALRRFVTPVAITGLHAPASITSGQTAKLHVALDANAPVGNISVHLTTDNPALLFTFNNTQSLNVTIVAGQRAVDVSLTAQPVSTATKVNVVATQATFLHKTTISVIP